MISAGTEGEVGVGRRGAVLCYGLTPGLQRTLVFERFEAGEVNRAVRAEVGTAGKALHVAMVLARLGVEAVTTGFNGGSTGRELARLLRARGVRAAFTPTRHPTRTCTTILDRATGTCTELVEEVARPCPEEVAHLERVAGHRLERACALALCGTLPRFLPAETYAAWAARAAALGIPVFIDSHGDPLCRVLASGPLLVKLNARELEMTVGVGVRDTRGMLRGARCLRDMGARWVMVTRGAGAAVLVGARGAWVYEMPRVDAVNPIGAGDAVLAGMIFGHLRGAGMPEAARWGFACGVAETVTLSPGDVDPGRVRALRAGIRARFPRRSNL